MAGAEIGKVWVRVVPNATKFREDLKKALTRVERTAELNIAASLDDRKFLSNVRDTMRQAQAFARIVANVDVETGNLRGTVRRAAEDAETDVDVGLNLADAAFKARIRESVTNAVQGVDARIPATVDGERIRRQLAEKVEAAEAGLRADIPVDVEQGATFRAHLEGLAAEIEALHPDVHVDADTATAAGRLAVLARTRFAKVVANVDTGSLTKAQTLLMGLSGARVAGNLASEFTNLATHLDVATPKIALAAIKIGSIAAGAVSAAGNLLTMGASLSKIAGLGLALPGIAAAFGVGLVGSFDGLQNILVWAKKVGVALNADTFTETRRVFGENFWSRASSGLRDFLQTAILPLIDGYKQLGFHLGTFWSAFFTGTAKGITASGGMAKMFAPLNESIDIASKGIGAFMAAIFRVGVAGGQFLPAMAQAFVDMSNSFAQWASTVDIAGVIRGGFQVAQQLVSVFGSVFGILGGITRAAEAAGGASFGAFAEGLAQVNAAINGPLLQGALTTIFSGAYQAVENLMPGVAALGGAFVTLAPTISQAMQLAGQSVGLLGAGIASALSTPALRDGVTAMFTGIRDGVAALAPHLEALGPKFGAVATVVGTLAKTLGPVLGAGLDAFAPVLENLAKAAEAVIPVLGQGLVDVFNALAPVLSWVSGLVAGFVQQFPGLSGVIIVIAGAIAGLVGLVVQIAVALGPVLTVIGSLVEMGGLLAAAWAAITGVFSAIVGIVTTVVTAIASVVAAIGIVPILIAAALIALVVLVVVYWDQIVAAIQAAWNWIVQIVQGGVNAVSGWVTTVLGAIAGWWTSTWSAIGNFLVGVWNNIRTWVSSGIQFVQSVVANGVAYVSNVWRSVWSGLAGFAASVWGAIRSVVSSGVQAVGNVISSVLGFVSGAWSSVWSGIAGFVSSVWSNIVAGASWAMRTFANAVVNGINDVLGFFVNLPGNIWNTLSNAASWMETIGHNLMIGLWNGIVGMAGRLYDMLRGVVNNVIRIAKNVLGIHSPSRVFMEIGDYTGQGMVLGLAGQAANVQNAMSALVEAPSASALGAPDVNVAGTTAGVSYDAGPVSLDGASLRLETGAGTIMARLVEQGSRVLQRA